MSCGPNKYNSFIKPLNYTLPWGRDRLGRRVKSAAGHPSKPTQPKNQLLKPHKQLAIAMNQNSKSKREAMVIC